MGILAETPKNKKENTRKETEFEKLKIDFKKSILDYYKGDATTVNEIKERLDFILKALDTFDYKTYESMRKKIKIFNNLNLNNKKYNEVLEFITFFSQYYAGFIFLGEKTTKQHYLSNNNIQESISLIKEYKKVHEFEKYLDNLEIRGNCSYANIGLIFNKNLKELTVTDMINIINTIMHEKVHALGTITRGETYKEYNEFATSFLMPFYLPIKEKTSEKLLGGTRVLNYRMDEIENRKEYIDVEYAEYFFMLPFLYDANKGDISKFLQKNLKIKDSKLNEIFDIYSSWNDNPQINNSHLILISSSYWFYNKSKLLKNFFKQNLEHDDYYLKEEIKIMKDFIKSFEEFEQNTNLENFEKFYNIVDEINKNERYSKIKKEYSKILVDIESTSKRIFTLKNLISVFEEYNSKFGNDKYFETKKKSIEKLYEYISKEKILDNIEFNKIYYKFLYEMIEQLNKIKNPDEMKDYSMFMPNCQNREKFV